MNLFKQSIFYYYCLTIRRTTAQKNVKQVTKALKEYEYQYHKIQKKYPDSHIDYHYEIVPKSNGLNVHFHAMIKCPQQMYLLFNSRGYSFKFEICVSHLAWDKYITKKSYTKQDILDYANKYYKDIPTVCNVPPPKKAEELFSKSGSAPPEDADSEISMTDQLAILERSKVKLYI